jgi:lysozyme
MIRGIDVSAVQGVIPWLTVKNAGIGFAFVKGYEGNKALDPNFFKNTVGAMGVGLVTGVYHFPYPLPPNPQQPLHDPIAQAELHFSRTGGFGSHSGEILAADLEWPAPQDWAKWGCTAPQLRVWYAAYLSRLEALAGHTPPVYIYPDFAAHVDFTQDVGFARYPLWMASYKDQTRWPVEGEAPNIPPPWTDWTFWQASGGTMKVWGSVPVDTDVYNGDVDALTQFAKGNPVT